ncbi:MAG: phytoene desaturase family protein [Myxococcota bacterium]|nr:phytoene desaturase family protein [Myxococcota bacterium]
MVRSLPRVVVVGAGIGGLAAAIDLAAAGLRVTVVERESGPGGKLSAADVDGVGVDAGPTVLTMRWVFEELFAEAGLVLEEHVRLEALTVLGRHAWPDGSRLDLHADHERTVEAIAAMSGRADAESYRAFAAHAKRIYETVEGPFLRSQRPTIAHLLRHTWALGPSVLYRIDAGRSMWTSLASRFEDPRLRQLFARYATYCGGSPLEAPATLSLIAHVEAAGVYRVDGGMAGFAETLATVARNLGVELVFGAEVRRVIVRGGRAVGVALKGGEGRDADAVIANVDVSAVGSGALGPEAATARLVTPATARSFSALTWAIRATARGFPLLHHNVFFSEDYAAEFEALVSARRVPARPTVYVCAEDRSVHGQDRGEERLLLVVNAPANGDDLARWGELEVRKCEEAVFRTMSRCGLTLITRASILTTPRDYARRFPESGGALYGPRPMSPSSSLTRQGARTKIAGLYLAGGSVHPGPGVPMAALSGRLAAACLKSDLAWTAPSRTAVTSGTTSTA